MIIYCYVRSLGTLVSYFHWEENGYSLEGHCSPSFRSQVKMPRERVKVRYRPIELLDLPVMEIGLGDAINDCVTVAE